MDHEAVRRCVPTLEGRNEIRLDGTIRAMNHDRSTLNYLFQKELGGIRPCTRIWEMTQQYSSFVPNNSSFLEKVPFSNAGFFTPCGEV